MQTLKINIPEGFVIDKFNQETGEVSFKESPKDIKERIKTFDDVLLDHNTNQAHFDNECEVLEPDEVAYRKLKMIAKSLNEGWTPDWTDGNWNKYYPWFEMGSPSGVGFSYVGFAFWHSASGVCSRLCFKSKELAEYAGQTFESIYKEFLTLNN